MNPNDPYAPSSIREILAQEECESRPLLAKVSLLLVLLAVVGAYYQQRYFPAPTAISRENYLLFGIVLLVLLVSSFVLALVSLFLRRGRSGVLVWAILALLISGSNLYLAGTRFWAARQAALARQEALTPPVSAQLAPLANPEPESAFEPAPPANLSPSSQSTEQWAARTESTQRVDPVQAKVDEAMKQSLPVDTVESTDLKHAIQPVMYRMGTAMAALDKAYLDLKGLGESRAGTLQTKEQIGARRTQLQNVVKAVQAWEQMQMTAESDLMTAMQRSRIPAKNIDLFMEGWRKSRTTSGIEIIKRLHACQRVAAQSMITALNILERELGHWVPDADQKAPLFKRPGVAEEFLVPVQASQKASQEGAACLQQLQARAAAKAKANQPSPAQPK